MLNLFKVSLFSILAIILLMPLNGFSMERREVIPVIQMLQQGKARLSPDKKSIIDENGHIVGKETSNTDLPKPKPAKSPAEAASDNTPPPPQLFFCSNKCAMISRHCYADENQNVVCINVCDREALICE